MARTNDWMDQDLVASVNGGSTEDAFAIQPAPARSETYEATDALGNSASPPQRFSVQFTATTEHIDLVERAKALLSNSHQGASLAELHLRALREFVASLEKRKYGATARRRKPTKASKADKNAGQSPGDEAPKIDCTSPDAAQSPRSRGSRGRYVPSAIRREVFERDSARCTFVDTSGQRCRETHALELHHLLAFADDGAHETSNLTLRCRAHNALAAEQDFGREHIERKRQSARHESFSHESSATITLTPPHRPSG